MRTARDSLPALLVLTLLCYAIAAVGGVVTAHSVHSWYPTLHKPFFNPPDWIFGPVWTLLYGMIAIAGWRLWRVAGFAPRAAWSAYGLQLLLNLLWSGVFFGLHQPLWALVDIALLWLAILLTVLLFSRRDQAAGWLLLPYFAWVSFAFLLNAAIVKLN